MLPKTAIILAGGESTRLGDLAKDIPKPLLPVNGKPIVQYAIENLKKYGITDFILAVSYHADKVQDYFKDGGDFGIKITYSVEQTPLGTGGAIKQAAEKLTEPFVLAWGDNLTDINIEELFKIYKKNNAKITVALAYREDIEHFGSVKLDDAKIVKFAEKNPDRSKALSNWINAGMFIVHPEVLDILPDGKSSFERQCLEKITDKNIFFAYKHEGRWFPTDTQEKYLLAKEAWR
ncbi:NDP-sugar synthase [Candidatus Woesearchaeota archaeon]|nr:NDP-sugar synthase [Candidatus Woesearchaeota archaeon]